MGNAGAKSARRHSTSTGSNTKRAQSCGPAALPAPPGKPILIPVSTEDSQPDIVGMRWERSPSNGGSAIIGYLVEHRRLGSPHWVRSSPSLCSFPELTLSGLEPGWRYQFRVRAQNRVGLSQPSELSDPLTVTLQRSAASAPRFDLELKDTVALENDQAEFIVHFSGTPIPKISWFKDGFEIFSSRRTRIVTENGKSTLLIHQTALNDEGEIKCTATNRAGHVSTRAKLILEAAPRIRLPRQYEDGLLFEQDETVRLKVSVAGRPPPNITWFHDAEIISFDDRHVIEASDSGEFSMRIPTAKRQDRGEYTVKAYNKLGEDTASFLVTVTDRPSAPGRTLISMTLGRSVTLSWKEPEDDGGCKIGTYIVEYYRIGWDVWLKATTCRQPKTTLSELIEGSEYKFRVKAENPYGVSDPSEESDVVFIPDPKRGINAPPFRADKTQSQREIHRGRGTERRDQNLSTPTKRTRSLTREEADCSIPEEFPTPPSRSVSVQRLLPATTARPSRADSRVTFADTVYLHVEKPLEDAPIAPVRPKSRRDKNQNLNVEESSKKQQTSVPRSLSPPTIVREPTFDDSGGEFYPSFRERSPSPIPKIRVQQSSGDEITNFPNFPREEDVDDEDENEEGKFRGSSEFILVLYPDAEQDKKTLLKKSLSEEDIEDDDEDLVPPPMSISLPELFSADHQVVEVLREAVSSTELLHERAMERFYKAVAVEKAEAVKKSEFGNSKFKDGVDFASSRLRNTRLRRRPSGSPVQSGNKIKWIPRRSSDTQTIPQRRLPETLLLPVPQLVASDPNLGGSSPDRDLKARVSPPLSPSSPTGLHRWDDITMPLIPEKILEDRLLIDDNHPRDVKTPDHDEVNQFSAEEYYEESTEEGTESEEESDSSEDLKMLKSRILAQPVVDEQDTYHPRGRPIPHISSSETDYKPIHTPNLGSNVSQPKSILKKRTEEEPVPVNYFGRPIPPEKQIVERQKPPEEPVQELKETPASQGPVVTLRKRSVHEAPEITKGTIMSDVDSENASLLNAAEVAKNRRRPLEKPALEKKPSIEEKEDLEARKAVVDHYTEIVREYSLNHSVNPPKYKKPEIPKVSPNSGMDHHLTFTEKQALNKVEEPTKKQTDVRSRKISVGSRGSTPAKEVNKTVEKETEKKKSPGNLQNESLTRRSRNVSVEKTMRLSSRSRNRDTSNSRSSSKTRREISQDRSSVKKKETMPQSRSSSRASSKERFRSSDSETSQRIGSRKSNKKLPERSRRGSYKNFDKKDQLKNEVDINQIDERLIAEAKVKIRTTMSYAIDLTLLVAAAYVYFFKKEILAIPIIGLLLYRRIQEDISGWMPKRWKAEPRKR